MKKTISLVMVIVMLLSCMAFAIPASAVENATTLIDEVEALYFENAPTIDGYITEAEWGEATVVVENWDYATTDDASKGAAYHKFFYNRINATDREGYDNFNYSVWLRWDLNRFYIGVKVTDPDKHSLKNGTTDTWNGDAIQTRIDKSGPNASAQGGKFTVTADRQKPWSTNNVPDFLFGYVEVAGGFSEAWENVSNKGMTSFSNNPLGTAGCVVAPAGSNYSDDTKAGITTYEVSIPWAYIYNGEYETLEMKNFAAGRDTPAKGPRGAIGKTFGMSLVVLNDGADANAGWDAYQSWGYGICETQQSEGAGCNTGSNSVKLVKDAVAQGAYTKMDPTELLDAKFSQENIDPAGVFYDYLNYDYDKTTAVKYEDLTTLTYDDKAHLSMWGSADFNGKIGNTNDSHGNVLDYRDNLSEEGAQTYIDTREGKFEYLYPTSYTFEFDIMYTDVEQIAEGYSSELYNWFGGAGGYSYMAGYFFNDNAFKIINSNDYNDVLATTPYDLKKDTWYNWKFQFDNESCNARLWIDDLSTEADNAESAWGELVLNSCWRYYYYSNEKVLENGTLLLYRMMNTQVAFDNVKIYNFATPAGEKVDVEQERPNNPSKPIGPIEGGNDLDIGDTVVKEDGAFTIPVTVTKQYLSATKLSFTFKFDASKGEFGGVKGLNEGTYKVEDLGNGEYLITITDFTQLKSLKAGDKFFEIVVNSDAESFADLSVGLKDAYTYQNTGDGMVFIMVAVVVSILGCAIVIGKRRHA